MNPKENNIQTSGSAHVVVVACSNLNLTSNVPSTLSAPTSYASYTPPSSVSSSFSTVSNGVTGTYTTPRCDMNTATNTTYTTIATQPIMAGQVAPPSYMPTRPAKVSWAQPASSEIGHIGTPVTAERRKGWRKMQAALSSQTNSSDEEFNDNDDESDIYGLRRLFQLSSEAMFGAKMPATVDESLEEISNDGKNVKVEIYRLPSLEQCRENVTQACTGEDDPSSSHVAQHDKRLAAAEKNKRAQELHLHRLEVEKKRIELLNIKIERVRTELESRKASLQQELERKKKRD